jgi:hypothetical protein
MDFRVLGNWKGREPASGSIYIAVVGPDKSSTVAEVPAGA